MGVYVLYNKNAGVKDGKERLKALKNRIENDVFFIDVLKPLNYSSLFSSLKETDKIIIAGGDGTISHFVNDVTGLEIKNDVLYFPTGTGNDFALDLGYKNPDSLFPINEYIKNLPYAVVKGKKYYFVNGVGFGIDGYCCEKGDAIRAKSNKKVNYTSIAIKGLLYDFTPVNAVVTVDGEKHFYEKVWLAPVMYGRFYGGGMMPTPAQSRKDPEQKLSVMVFYGAGKIKTLSMFPSIFSGEHVKYQSYVEILRGNEISVAFDKKTPLQIDGETFSDISSFSAFSPAKICAPICV